MASTTTTTPTKVGRKRNACDECNRLHQRCTRDSNSDPHSSACRRCKEIGHDCTFQRHQSPTTTATTTMMMMTDLDASTPCPPDQTPPPSTVTGRLARQLQALHGVLHDLDPDANQALLSQLLGVDDGSSSSEDEWPSASASTSSTPTSLPTSTPASTPASSAPIAASSSETLEKIGHDLLSDLCRFDCVNWQLYLRIKGMTDLLGDLFPLAPHGAEETMRQQQPDCNLAASGLPDDMNGLETEPAATGSDGSFLMPPELDNNNNAAAGFDVDMAWLTNATDMTDANTVANSCWWSTGPDYSFNNDDGMDWFAEFQTDFPQVTSASSATVPTNNYDVGIM
ncbi:hypothetical protein IWZ03DRAFT_364003 [Phyllosticta citriasiana]|uniref:Zn(2)-C6 fungal-type domain-containing protein n=1 Tax=Phyllosticta citriasiana TaxID=595635 RepID=A0ABR1K8C3_9PEZI